MHVCSAGEVSRVKGSLNMAWPPLRIQELEPCLEKTGINGQGPQKYILPSAYCTGQT